MEDSDWSIGEWSVGANRGLQISRVDMVFGEDVSESWSL